MKRMLAILLTMVMLIVSLPILAADTTNDAWSTGWTVGGPFNGGTLTHFVSTDSYQGEGALHLVYTTDDDTSTNDNASVRVNSATNAPTLQLMASTTYKLSFYVKVVKNETKDNGTGNEALMIRIDNGYTKDTNLSDGLAADDDNDGWQKYEKTFTTDATITDGRWGFAFGTGDVDVYIDCVELIPVETALGGGNQTIGQNVLNTKMSCFDDGKPKFAPNTSDETVALSDMGWSTYGWDGGTLSLKVSPSVTYQGSGAMHIAFKTDGVSGTNDRFVVRATNASHALQPNTTYKLSFYAKVNTNDIKDNDTTKTREGLMIKFGDGGDTNLSANLAADDDNDGWQKYEKTITTGASVSNTQLGFWGSTANIDVYIDNVKLEVVSGTTATNILSEKMTYFDEDTPSEEPEIELSSTADETVDVTTLGWTAPNWGSTNDAEKEWHKVSPSVSYKGSGSMHLQYVTDGVTSNDRFAIRSDNAAHKLDGSSQYKLTMYVNILTNTLKDVDTNGTNYAACVSLGNSGNIYLTNDNPLLTATEKEGWQKLETTVKSTAQTDRLEIYLAQGTADLYIDCISIQKINADGSLGDNIFTDEMMYNFDTDSSFAPDTSDEDASIDCWDYSWECNEWGTANVKQKSFKISPSVSYKGSGALHLVYEGDGVPGNDRFAIRTKNILESGKTYKLSYYAKVLHNGPQDEGTDDTAYVYAYNKGNVSLNNTAYYVGEPDNGWQKIEIEFTAAGTTLELCYMQRGKADVYIDCVSCKLVENGTETEMLSDKQRNFDEDTPAEEVIVPPVTDRPANVPDMTADTNIRPYGWEVSAFKNGSAFGGSTAYTAAITSEVAYEGKNSLHITFTKDSTTDSILVRPLAEHNLVSGSEYTVTMYFKVMQNSANGLGIKSVNTVTKKPGASAEITADKDGWYKYTETGTIGANALRITIGCDVGACELYVDNVSVVTGGTDLFADKKGTFETEKSETFTVTKARLFDAEGNEVTDITAAESGKTITAAAAVTNYFEADTFKGQLIVCVYKDNVLEKVDYSDSKVIATTDGAKTLVADIELPTITAEDADDYTVRVFVWEAVDTMVPLGISTSF